MGDKGGTERGVGDAAPTSMEAMSELSENMSEAYKLAQEAWAYALEKQANGGGKVDLDPFNMVPAMADLQKTMLEKPETLIDATIDLWARQATLWTNALAAMTGAETRPVPGADASADKRFKGEAWQKHFAYDYVKQSYLLASNWMRETVRKAEADLPEEQRLKLDFFTERFVEAMSPANFVHTNPEVLEQTVKEKGANLVRGMRAMLKDMKRGDGQIWISQTDMDAFSVGENIAVTPGKVVFQNDLIQLIQYEPATDKVFSRPLLITPPWINKFYIMDLNAKKSMVRWLVAQGYTVFMISWRNPEAGGPERDFEDYIAEGLYPAIEAVKKETRRKDVNLAGYCIGGTLVSCALAHMAATGDESVHSVTFFTAQADFEKAGELRAFIDDKSLAQMQQEASKSGGVIGAQNMAQAFNLLRGNELIWNYVVNNYYMGKEPPAFDLLYWNSDSTRMPAKCHLSYLRNFYRDNALAKGKLSMLGETLDLGAVSTPVYSVCTKEDHIAPAESVYRGVKLFGGPVRLVVGGSGHIAGVINPPDPKKVKYQYWVNPQPRAAWPETLDAWLEAAVETPGSWWPDWDAWLAERSGGKVNPRKPGARLGVIEDAPGAYVKARSDAPEKTA